jgi:hypothetical protein
MMPDEIIRERVAEEVKVTRAAIGEKLILRHLLQLYCHDFTEFEDMDVDEHGLFRYDHFDRKWQCATPVANWLLASSGLSVVFGWHRLPPHRLLA